MFCVTSYSLNYFIISNQNIPLSLFCVFVVVIKNLNKINFGKIELRIIKNIYILKGAFTRIVCVCVFETVVVVN